MATREQLKKYDEKRSIMFGESVITNGKEDFFGKGFAKNGRRNIWQFERFNDQGVQVSCWMYVTDLYRALKSGDLSVYIK